MEAETKRKLRMNEINLSLSKSFIILLVPRLLYGEDIFCPQLFVFLLFSF